MICDAKICSTKYLKKMFGFTDIVPSKKGRFYNQFVIKKIMQDKGIDVWNPVNRKSPKNHVKGGTLINL